jgi:hypothetical protein
MKKKYYLHLEIDDLEDIGIILDTVGSLIKEGYKMGYQPTWNLEEAEQHKISKKGRN